jgi:hypothetical protein
MIGAGTSSPTAFEAPRFIPPRARGFFCVDLPEQRHGRSTAVGPGDTDRNAGIAGMLCSGMS